jgi:hypothetical protein
MNFVREKNFLLHHILSSQQYFPAGQLPFSDL